MELILNPFKSYPLDLCTGGDELRPFITFIYFFKGIAYATDAYLCLALALKDIDADEKLIACLEGRKISRDDYRFMNQYDWLAPQANGIINLNEDGTKQLNLQQIDENDTEHEYQTIFDIYENAKAERETKSKLVSKIKINLTLLSHLSIALNNRSTARLKFLKDPERVFLEFAFYTNSFALLMPMIDND